MASSNFLTSDATCNFIGEDLEDYMSYVSFKQKYILQRFPLEAFSTNGPYTENSHLDNSHPEYSHLENSLPDKSHLG